jgi:hypothetical protein
MTKINPCLYSLKHLPAQRTNLIGGSQSVLTDIIPVRCMFCFSGVHFQQVAAAILIHIFFLIKIREVGLCLTEQFSQAPSQWAGGLLTSPSPHSWPSWHVGNSEVFAVTEGKKYFEFMYRFKIAFLHNRTVNLRVFMLRKGNAWETSIESGYKEVSSKARP